LTADGPPTARCSAYSLTVPPSNGLIAAGSQKPNAFKLHPVQAAMRCQACTLLVTWRVQQPGAVV